MFKKSITIVLSFVLIFAALLCACEESKDFGENGVKKPNGHTPDMGSTEVSEPERKKENTETVKDFYQLIENSKTFWFEMEIVSDKQTYRFTQATNGVNITSILDYEGDSNDVYEVIEFKEELAHIHTLNFKEKKYDTSITKNYQDFLFKGEKAETYANPSQKGSSKNKDYQYFEKFDTSSSESGKIDGCNIYYFNDNRLECIEVVENGNVTMTMKFVDYGVEVPDDIYLTPPSDFKKGTLQVDTTIDYGSMDWGS